MVEIPNNISQRFDDRLLVRRVESGDLPELLALLSQLHEETLPLADEDLTSTFAEILASRTGRPSKVLLLYRTERVEVRADRRAGEIRLLHADRRSARPAPDRAHRSCRRSG
jgi:hypothetical protein